MSSVIRFCSPSTSPLIAAPMTPPRCPNGHSYALLVERGEHLALVIDALGHLEPEPPRHERPRLPVEEVVEVGTIRARDLEHVAEAARRQKRGDGTLVLSQCVDD